MFDNLGVGEFFMLAIMALLFFGPERLPQMGAKLGQWLGKLTYQSKLFMNQWREEALAIHEAVEEVRVIRNEIAAAQRQIAESMRAAQSDVSESLEEVKQTVSGSRMSLDELAAAAKEEERQRQLQEAEQKARGEQRAIEKTQAILADVQARLANTGVTAGVEQPAPPLSAQQPPLPEPTEVDPRTQIKQAQAEWRKTLTGTTTPPTETPPARPDAVQTETRQPVSGPTTPGETVGTPTLGGSRVVQASGEKSQVSTAFDRTAQIMERMRRQMAGEPVEDLETLVTPPPAPSPPPEAPPQPPTSPASSAEAEDEWTRIHNLIQEELKGKPKETPVSSATQPPTTPTTVGAQVTAPARVTTDDGAQTHIAELNRQVTSLQEEIKSLKKAIEALRAEMLLKTALVTQTPTRGEHG